MVKHRINIATEDELSEIVGIRLVSEMGSAFEVGLTLRKGGFGYLRNSLKSFCQMASRDPMLLLTDLDQAKCPASLIEEWMGSMRKPDKLLFRVAVREVESWLLSDHDAMASLMGCSKAKLPKQPDTLADPKQTLLRFARNAPRNIRTDLIAEDGVIASQGLGYNQRLGDFVREQWSPERAASRSDSLLRVRQRLIQLANAMG